MANKLPVLRELSETSSQNLFVSDALKRLGALVRQAELLAAQYDAVVPNPPYMGGKGMHALVKKFATDHFPDAKTDLFACFIERGYTLAKCAGHIALVTMQGWMFLSSYENFRKTLLQRRTVQALIHLPYDGKRPTAMSLNFGVAVMSMSNRHVAGYQGHYSCSRYYELGDDGVPIEFPTPNERVHTVPSEESKKIPGSPIAYWVSEHTREVYGRTEPLSSVAKPCVGMRTGDNERFLRQWHEVSLTDSNSTSTNASEAFASGKKWFPFVKGGDFRKWFGNVEQIVNRADNGHEIKKETLAKYPQLSWDNLGWKISNEAYYFRSAITWTAVSSSCFGVRFVDEGNIFGTGGSCIFPDGPNFELLGSLLCSNVGHYFMGIRNPTLNINIEDVAAIPVLLWRLPEAAREIARTCWASSRIDWNAYERSWDFQSLPILTVSSDPAPTLESNYTAWIAQNHGTIAEMKRLEEENNRLFIDAYELQDELTPDVPMNRSPSP